MKKEMNVQIGARVRTARERLHMSRETLAELIDVSALFVGYIECGQKGMSLATLTAICETLHTSADYILLGREASTAHDSEAARLLRNLPEEYLPLAADSLRTLLQAIAAIQAKEKSAAPFSITQAAKDWEA